MVTMMESTSVENEFSSTRTETARPRRRRASGGLGAEAREAVAKMATLLRRIAGPAEIGERTGAQIRRASQRVGMPYGWTKSVWYRERKDILASELMRVEAVAARLEQRARWRADLVEDSRRVRAQLVGRAAD
jgi:hypothetical protein